MDHVVTNDIKTNEDQHNNAIKNDPKFDNDFSLSSRTKEPLPVVTVSLRGGNEHRLTTVSGTTYLWYSGATDSMIKIRHTK